MSINPALMGSRTQTALRLLIQNSLERQSDIILDDPTGLTNQRGDWLRSFCTIRVTGPRGSGHTTALKTIAQDFENPYFVCPNQHVKDFLYRDERGCTMSQISTSMRGLRIDAILVDMAWMLSTKQEDELYRVASCCCLCDLRPFCMIFVQ